MSKQKDEPKTPLEKFFQGIGQEIKHAFASEKERLAHQLETFLTNPQALVTALPHLEPLFKIDVKQIAQGYRYIGTALLVRANEIDPLP